MSLCPLPIPYGWPPLLSQRVPWLSTLQGVERLGRQLSGQVNFERAEALGCWELAWLTDSLLHLAVCVGRTGHPGVAAPGPVSGLQYLQVVAPGPSSSGRLGQRQYLPAGSPATKRAFLVEGASQIQSNRCLTGRPLCTRRCGRRCLWESLGMTEEDTAVIEL